MNGSIFDSYIIGIRDLKRSGRYHEANQLERELNKVVEKTLLGASVPEALVISAYIKSKLAIR